MSRCEVSGDMVGSLLFTWTVMVLHDAYFFAVHTAMHYCKALYRRVHQWHHATSGDLTVFSTAYGDVLDIAVTFAPFYAAVVAYVYWQPAWNPVAVVCLMWAVNGVDMMGHCGYRLPLWVYAPGSLGVLLTPLAQRPKHHYIHHLDPRFNRSLYFTWWDRLAGSFRDHHPKIPNESVQQVSKAAHDHQTSS
jgi:lathosterol oxidase